MLHVTPANAPSGVLGLPYEFRIRAVGGEGPYRFKVLGDLPAGLSLANELGDGIIRGVPAGDGGMVTIEVTDQGQADVVEIAGFTIDVSAPAGMPKVAKFGLEEAPEAAPAAPAEPVAPAAPEAATEEAPPAA